jgi:hypothetical protein
VFYGWSWWRDRFKVVVDVAVAVAVAAAVGNGYIHSFIFVAVVVKNDEISFLSVVFNTDNDDWQSKSTLKTYNPNQTKINLGVDCFWGCFCH